MSCETLTLGLRDVVLALLPLLLLVLAAGSGWFPGERSLERLRSRRAAVPPPERPERVIRRPGRERVPAALQAFALGHPRAPPSLS